MLSFIGGKMLLPLAAEGLVLLLGDGNGSEFSALLQRFLHHEFDQTVINVSLGVVVGTIIISIILSLMFPHKTEIAEDDAE